MSSDRQTEANRINAQKSTGPKSAQGKATSSMNALKSGIDAESEVLPFENLDNYKALVAEYYDRFPPATPEERCLVDTLIRNEWFLRRYTMVETGIWTREFKVTTHGSIGTAFNHHSEEFSRVERRLNSAQRNFDRALTKLQQLQAKRLAEPPETKKVEPKLASFLTIVPPPPEIAPETPATTENPDKDPPIAA